VFRFFDFALFGLLRPSPPPFLSNPPTFPIWSLTTFGSGCNNVPHPRPGLTHEVHGKNFPAPRPLEVVPIPKKG